MFGFFDVVLRPNEFDALMATLKNPPPPNDALRRLMQKHAPWDDPPPTPISEAFSTSPFQTSLGQPDHLNTASDREGSQLP